MNFKTIFFLILLLLSIYFIGFFNFNNFDDKQVNETAKQLNLVETTNNLNLDLNKTKQKLENLSQNNSINNGTNSKILDSKNNSFQQKSLENNTQNLIIITSINNTNNTNNITTNFSNIDNIIILNDTIITTNLTNQNLTNNDTNLSKNLQIVNFEILNLTNGVLYIENFNLTNTLSIKKVLIDNIDFNISDDYNSKINMIKIYSNLCTNILDIGAHKINIFLNSGENLSLEINLTKKDKIINNGILIPAYIYPSQGINTPEFSKIINFKNKNIDIPIYAILNVFNGPGNLVDTNYLEVINNFNNKNINTLAYVYTSNGNRNISDIKADIDNWKLLYPNVSNLFFDEFSNLDDLNIINYYKDLINYSKSKGFNKFIANPGTTTIDKYYSLLDLDFILMYENGIYPTQSIFDLNPSYKNKKSVLVHSQIFDSNSISLILNNSNLIYLTDDIMPNPWDTLTPFMDNLCRQILIK